MKTTLAVFAQSATVVELVCMTCCAVAGPTRTARAARPANEAVKALDAKLPESLFENPALTAEGRNPFFPNARPEVSQPRATSRPRQTATINGRTLQPDAEGIVTLPDGTRLRIKWEEIKEPDRKN